MIGDLDYFFPQAGYLLFFLVFLWLGLWSLFLYRQRQLAKFASPRLLNQLLIPRSSWMFCFKTILMSLSWLFACLSLMGPYGNVRYASSQQPNKPSSDSNLPRRKIHDVIFLLDTSPSMGVRDTTEELSRLEKSKQIVEQILQRLRGQEASLYAFSSELIPLVPPTLDYIFTRLLLDDITISEGETNFKAALEGLKAEFFTVPSSRLYSLIILSDGEDREVQKLTGDAKQKAIAKLATIIPNPAEFHLRVFTIGIGSKQGGEVPNVRVQGRKVQSKLEPELLEALAQNGRGGYFEASQMPIWSLADTLFDQIQQDFPYYPDPAKQAREVLQTSPSNILYDLYFQWPLALSLLCLLAYLCLPDAKGKTNSFHLSLIFFLLIPFGLPSLSPEEKQESAQGIALFAARDYNKATDIFERLSKRSLKNWQKSLALYDLGTIYLAQGQWKQAQDLYQSIAASEIHSPTFLRYLAFNEAIAYFGQAQEQLSKMPDQALFLWHQGQKGLEEVKHIDCQLQQLEESFSTCQEAKDVQSLTQQSNQLRNAIRQQLRLHALKHLNFSTLLVLLSEGLKDIQALPSDSPPSYVAYQAKSLLPLWEALHLLPLSAEKKENAEQGEENYKTFLKTLEEIDKKHVDSSLSAALKTIEDLLKSDQQHSLELLLVDYQLQFIDAPLTQDGIEKLKQRQEELLPQFDQQEAFKEAEADLSLSLQSLEEKQQISAQFFFLSAFYALQTAVVPKSTNSQEILKRSLDLANQALQLNRLYDDQASAAIREKMQARLKQAQNGIFPLADSFLPRVLEEQKTHFQGKEKKCQNHPWDQVIPLFDKGYQAAASAQKTLENRASDSQQALFDQGNTLFYWQQALDLLNQQHASATQQESDQNERKSGSFDASSTFYLLQQMYLEDQTEGQTGPVREMQTW